MRPFFQNSPKLHVPIKNSVNFEIKNIYFLKNMKNMKNLDEIIRTLVKILFQISNSFLVKIQNE
jgi:hypothetical protein